MSPCCNLHLAIAQDWFPGPPPHPGQYLSIYIGHSAQFKPQRENSVSFLSKFSFCFPLSQLQPAALPACQLFDPCLPHHSSFFMLKYVAMIHENTFFLKLDHYFHSFTGGNKNSVLPAKLIAAKLP